MKKFIILSIQFICFCCWAQNTQDLKKTIRYEYELTAKSSKDNLNNINQTICALDIIENTSMFYDMNQYERKKIMLYGKSDLPREDKSALALAIRPVFKWIVISEDNKNKYLSSLDSKTKYMTIEPIDEIKWVIDPKTSNWNNYTVQKATTTYAGRDWNVLFTQDIPVKSGPYKLNNLPGLVVKAWDSEEHYVFELLNSKEAELDLKVIAADQYPETDKKKINKAIQINNNKTINQRFEEQGITIGGESKERFNIKIGDVVNDIERI